MADDNRVWFDWKQIAEIAAMPYPSMLIGDSGAGAQPFIPSRQLEHDFQNISLCRSLLAARHAGYLEGQANPGVADPFAPQPTSVGGYMKRMEGGER